MRRALVLGGGGARGAYQVGMLDVLVRQKRVDFHVLRGTKVSGLDILKRTVDLLTDEVYLDDIRGAVEWNAVLRNATALIGAANAVGGQPALAAAVTALQTSIAATRKRPVGIHVLAPREWYGDDNSATAFAPALIAKAIQHGRDVAKDPGLWLWP